jgi:uncharacterized DUF497 family protein
MTYNKIEFEWDETKAISNFRKHGIRFSEAVTCWLDGYALEIPDTGYFQGEERWVRLGCSNKAKVLVVVYCEKIEFERIRIISARKATKNEQSQYDERRIQ